MSSPNPKPWPSDCAQDTTPDNPIAARPNRELLRRAMLGEIDLTPDQQREVLGVDLSQAVAVPHPEVATLAAWIAIEVVGGKFLPGWEWMREAAKGWRVPVDGDANEWLPVIEHYMIQLFGGPIVEGRLIGYLNQYHHLSPAEAKELPLSNLAGLLKQDAARAKAKPARAEPTAAESEVNVPESKLAPDPAVSIDQEAQAIALLFQHPDKSLAEIAEAVKVDRTTLYKWPKFRLAAERAGKLKPRGPKDSLPSRGHKTRDGRLEAYQEERKDK